MQTSAVRSISAVNLTGCEAFVSTAADLLRREGLLPANGERYIILPGLCDVHVHFREPGFSYKETILTGTSSAARGGYTSVCTMPNLSPVPDSIQTLETQLEIIRRDAVINVLPYGAITKGEKGEELSDMDSLAPFVSAFSDDGKGVQDESMMRSAMTEAVRLGKLIAAHCEVNSLLNGGYIHDGEYAAEHGHRGICSQSEYLQIERDLKLAEETGAAYHVCHISAKESVELIRSAKKRGLNVTCETGPHYLTLCDADIEENGRFKMNPPLRSADDRAALIEGIIDGTIDMIATDHAPHSSEEKSLGLEKSSMGVVGLETAFAVLYTELVLKNIITVEKLAELMSVNPRKRFEIEDNDSFTVFEVSNPYIIDPGEFLSLGRATPFEGKKVYGRCVMTVCNGRVCYKCSKK